MGNQLSQALADAGLVSRQAVEKKAAVEITRSLRKQRSEQRERYLDSDEGRPESFSSPSDFMMYVRERLKDEGYSERLMKTLFQEAHRFADAKLTQKHRGRMHAFLCQLDEKLKSTPVDEQPRILRDGKRAFKQMNARNL